MSKVLVIPDTHLKPKMFDLADKIVSEYKVDYVIQLGDNFDDFYCYEEQYKEHLGRMVAFKYEHPETVWLYGNHEMSYILGRPVTGNTFWGEKYSNLYKRDFNPKFVHIDNNIVFSHAGVFQEFLDREGIKDDNPTSLIDKINNIDSKQFWLDDSPLWARYRYDTYLQIPKIFKEKEILQITGHTPTEDIETIDSVISTDVFSTNWGKKYGSEQMIIVDTLTKEIKKIPIDFRKTFGEERSNLQN